MAKKRALTVSEDDLPELLAEVTKTAKDPILMRAVFMLSYYAGLRVQEIAGLEWDKNIMAGPNRFLMSEAVRYNDKGKPMRHGDGTLKKRSVPSIFISSAIGKYSNERYVAMHSQLQAALSELYNSRDTSTPYVVPSGKDWASQELPKRAHALKMRITRIYKALGRFGFSSHSGRRSFITHGARKANAFNRSLHDVQLMAGHKNIATTQGYIDASVDNADLVEGLYT